jgi:hypothetical protein
MTTYPDIITEIRATLPLTVATSQAVLKTEYANGIESRRLVWDSVRRSLKLYYSVMTWPIANDLRRFYESVQGSFHSFFFFFPHIEVFVKELVGTLLTVNEDPIPNILNLPSKGAQTYSLYTNGSIIPLVENTHYTLTASGGGDGQDIATLLYEPLVGDIFHFSFTGRLNIRARFSDSPIMFNDVKNVLSSTEVELVGLEPQP